VDSPNSLNKDMASKCSLTEINIEVTMRMVNLTGEDNTIGAMELAMKVSLKMVWEREMGHGWVKMEMNIKDISARIVKMDKESSDGQMETFIQENSVMIWDKVTAKWNGEMVVYTKVNGNEDYLTVEVFELINS